MTEPGDRDERMNRLEARLRRVEQDAAAARILAGGADRDVAEFRSEFRDFRDQNNRVLNAMRADLVDLRTHVDTGFARVEGRFARVDEQFARVDEQFARVEEQFAQVDRNFLGIRGVLDAQAAGQQQIVALLDTLIRQQGDDHT